MELRGERLSHTNGEVYSLEKEVQAKNSQGKKGGEGNREEGGDRSFLNSGKMPFLKGTALQKQKQWTDLLE